MDVIELLESASLLAPEATAGADDLTGRDVWDHLVRDEWETALGLLEEFRGGAPLPLPFWERLAEEAERLHLPRSAAWCHWRSAELRNGMVRADLVLVPVGRARRTTPIPAHGVLRPLWDIGHRSPAGGTSLSIAGLWIEQADALEPGGRATVRLVPLTPAHWRHLAPGRQIRFHEDRDPSGTATVLEVRPPAGAELR